MNLAIDGETSKSWSTGLGDRVSPDGIFHNTNYATYAPNYPTQQERFQQVISAAQAGGDRIGTVTVQLGANDLFAVAGTAGVPRPRPGRASGAGAGADRDAAAELRGDPGRSAGGAAGRRTVRDRVPQPVRRRPEHPLAPLSAPAVQGVNQVAEALAAAFGGTYASFYDVILGRERELTLIARDDEVNNVHLNDAGYAAAGAELIRVASANNTPEPATLTMFAVGLLGAVGYRGVRRGRAA